MWPKCMDPMMSSPRSDRIVDIRIKAKPINFIIFSVYLPARSGSTEGFRDLLDLVDAAILHYCGEMVVIAGDLNADLGSLGGPFVRIPS